MEIFLLFLFLFFTIISSFLFLQERQLTKNWIKIHGKVVGYSNTKFSKNKFQVHPIIEFTHPNGQQAWIDTSSPLQNNFFMVGKSVAVLSDKNEFRHARVKGSDSIKWATIFISLGFLSLFFLLDSYQTYTIDFGVCLAVFLIVLIFVLPNLWKEANGRLGITTSWMAWRLKNISASVFNESELKQIQFLKKSEYLKLFKRHNLFQSISDVVIGLTISMISYGGISAYFEIKAEMAPIKRSTASVVEFNKQGKAVLEFYDIEGVKHHTIGSRAPSEYNVGKSFDVFYRHGDFRRTYLEAPSGSALNFILYFTLGFALLLTLQHWFLRKKFPKYKLDKIDELVITAESLSHRTF